MILPSPILLDLLFFANLIVRAITLGDPILPNGDSQRRKDLKHAHGHSGDSGDSGVVHICAPFAARWSGRGASALLHRRVMIYWDFELRVAMPAPSVLPLSGG